MKATGRVMLVVLALLLGLAPALAAEYWQTIPEEGLYCRESRPGCHLLQMAMAGSFAQLDLQDSISVRVFSAVLPQLRSLTEADFAHFTQQFDVEEETVQRAYYIALGNCLLADIKQGGVRTPEEAAVYRVLLLFLYPEGEENAALQKQAIRGEMTEDILFTMAQTAGVPEDFVAYLIEHDDWRVLGEGA